MLRYSVLIILCFCSLNLFAQSTSQGTVGNGSLKKGCKLKYWGKGYTFYSPFAYYVLNRAWVHCKVHITLKQAFVSALKSDPYPWRVMDCSHKKGGKVFPHSTHQNGLSVDIATPLRKKTNNGYKMSKKGIHKGIAHYLMVFDNEGNLNKKHKIDFERLAQFILLLDQCARNNGLYIQKVILKTQGQL